MRKNTPKNKKQAVLNKFTNGETATEIASSTGVPRSTIYECIKSSRENFGKRTVLFQNFRLLENKVKRLEGIIEILQTASCRASVSLDIKLCS